MDKQDPQKRTSARSLKATCYGSNKYSPKTLEGFWGIVLTGISTNTTSKILIRFFPRLSARLKNLKQNSISQKSENSNYNFMTTQQKLNKEILQKTHQGNH